MPTVEEDVQYLIQIVKKDTEIKERKKLTESSTGRPQVQSRSGEGR